MACSEDDTKDKSKIGVRNIILSYTGRNSTKKAGKNKREGGGNKIEYSRKGECEREKGEKLVGATPSAWKSTQVRTK